MRKWSVKEKVKSVVVKKRYKEHHRFHILRDLDRINFRNETSSLRTEVSIVGIIEILLCSHRNICDSLLLVDAWIINNHRASKLTSMANCRNNLLLYLTPCYARQRNEVSIKKKTKAHRERHYPPKKYEIADSR
jgi:hypothetical protein